MLATRGGQRVRRQPRPERRSGSEGRRFDSDRRLPRPHRQRQPRRGVGPRSLGAERGRKGQRASHVGPRTTYPRTTVPPLRHPPSPPAGARLGTAHPGQRHLDRGGRIAGALDPVLIFILQNQARVRVHFLGWSPSMPLGVAMLLAAVIGGVAVAPGVAGSPASPGPSPRAAPLRSARDGRSCGHLRRASRPTGPAARRAASVRLGGAARDEPAHQGSPRTDDGVAVVGDHELEPADRPPARRRRCLAR